MSQSPQYDYPPPPIATSTSGWAIFSLIAGVLAWLGVFGLGGIAAVISGHIAKSQIHNSGGRISGDGLATAGLVLGYLNIALALAGLCIGLLVLAGVVAAPAICIPFANQFSH
jgi:hypothetical protein